jgi:hypothetical protein
LLNMESVYHIVTIRVNETSWAHIWRLRSRYLGMGYDIYWPLSARSSFSAPSYGTLTPPSEGTRGL